MNWNNASIDEPPPHGQNVVICVEGVYYLATYDGEKNCYRLLHRSESVFNPDRSLIYWMIS